MASFYVEIINSNQPIFYLKVTGTDYMLVDGFTYELGGGVNHLRINGNLPSRCLYFQWGLNRYLWFTDAVSVSLSSMMLPSRMIRCIDKLKTLYCRSRLTAMDLYPGTLTWTIVPDPANGTLSGTAPAYDLYSRSELQWTRQLHLQGERWHGRLRTSPR